MASNLTTFRCDKCGCQVEALGDEAWHQCPKAAQRGTYIKMKAIDDA